MAVILMYSSLRSEWTKVPEDKVDIDMYTHKHLHQIEARMHIDA